MKLTRQDAYALRRAMTQQVVPDDLDMNPLVRALLTQLDWQNNQNHYDFLRDLITHDTDFAAQVLLEDPLAPPPPANDDHAYVVDYLQQVVTQDGVDRPDMTRTNGSTELLMHLYQTNVERGAEAARQAWQQIKREQPELAKMEIVIEPQRLTSPLKISQREPIQHLDEDEIVQAAEVTAIIGQPGSGKSLWALMKLAEIATRGETVVYVAGEGINPDRVRALAMAYGYDLEALSQNFHIFDGVVDLTSEMAMDQFLQTIGHLQPAVITFDTFAACTPGIEENSSKDMQPILNRLRERIVTPLDCAVLLIHHTTKDGKNYRGSSALKGNVANLYYLRDDDDRVILTADKRRDAERGKPIHYRIVPFETRPHPATGKLITSAAMMLADAVEMEADHLTDDQLQILTIVEEHGQGGTPYKILAAMIELSTGSLYRRLHKLISRGLLRSYQGEPYHITEEGRDALRDSAASATEQSE